jgi:hypothetical protein
MFRIGQKVVCVDAKGVPLALVEGRVYVILRITPPYLYLAGVCGERPTAGMYADRFRPIVEKKTDISVFEEILKRAPVGSRLPANVT